MYLKHTPMKLWGKDHWSLLAYLECCQADASAGLSLTSRVGEIDKRKLRCNLKVHPAHAASLYGGPRTWDATKFGTRLNDGRVLPQHDDWDCLNDLDTEGLLDVLLEGSGSFTLSDKGLNLAHKVRRHKAKGGTFSTFTIKE